ncbi:MAG: Lrp/AsnC family transcriptional regulator [Eubacterium sp.]|nr:Lrp/AsnC family transcriptional regulator [Eubacterium sp.]
MNKLLKILENNARLTNKEIAVMLDKSEKEVEKDITLLEDTGILKGYKAIIDKDKAEVETVTALIEIKVQPKYGHGFNDVANRISQLEEVESIYLMSGGFDFAVMVNDKSFQEVAMFVANRLSPLEGVVSTATHFILKRYKEQGVIFSDEFKDDRGIVSLC